MFELPRPHTSLAMHHDQVCGEVGGSSSERYDAVCSIIHVLLCLLNITAPVRVFKQENRCGKAYSCRLPVSFRLCRIALYTSSEKTDPGFSLTLLAASFSHFLSCAFLTQLIHHLSMLLMIMGVLNCLCSLCCASTKRRKPALKCSRSNSDMHLSIREIRRLL